MEQKGFLLDQKYCIGCQTCVAACRARNELTPGVYPRQATSSQVKAEGPYISTACNHCSAPACVEVCPTGALAKRNEDGIVTHDPEICIACYSCKAGCPYDVPQENDVTGKMVKCDMCAARLDAGDEPACVLSCPAKVLTVGTIADFEADGAVSEGFDFEVHSTDPNIRFVNN